MLDINHISNQTICAAINVHRELGPGLLESAYEACLMHELARAGLRAEVQKTLPIRFRGEEIDCGYRIDMLVENQLIVELKAVDKIQPIHKAQILSYLKMSNCSVGLLINFNVMLLKDGIHRIVNNYGGVNPKVQKLED